MDYFTKELVTELKVIAEGLAVLHSDLQKHTEALHERDNFLAQQEKVASPLRAELQLPEVIKTAYLAGSIKTKRRENIRLGLEVAGFFAVFAYAIVSFYMWQEMKKSSKSTQIAAIAAEGANQAARDAMIRSQRPWVSVDLPIRLNRPMIVKPKQIDIGSSLVIKNYGPSPALHVLTAVSVVTDVKKFAQQQDSACNLAERTERGEGNPLAIHKFGTPIFPQGRFSQSFETREDNLAHPNLTVLYLAGCIIYRDQFDIIHHTRFCVETPGLAKDFTMAANFVSCNIGQEAD
jgi:hypothetical protein